VQFEGIHIICITCGCSGHLHYYIKKKNETMSSLNPNNNNQQQHAKKPFDISKSSTPTTSFREKIMGSNQSPLVQ